MRVCRNLNVFEYLLTLFALGWSSTFFDGLLLKIIKRQRELRLKKTESSYRMIYLPSAVVEELRRVKREREERKALLGEEYRDYDFVVSQLNGRPYELRLVDKMLYKLIEKNDLRPVVAHSLRHSSTSLKLKLSRGNIKAVQGDTDHAEVCMVTDIYAHGFDADRKLIAQEMDNGFFSKVGQGAKANDLSRQIIAAMKKIFQAYPELLSKLMET